MQLQVHRDIAKFFLAKYEEPHVRLTLGTDLVYNAIEHIEDAMHTQMWLKPDQNLDNLLLRDLCHAYWIVRHRSAITAFRRLAEHSVCMDEIAYKKTYDRRTCFAYAMGKIIEHYLETSEHVDASVWFRYARRLVWKGHTLPPCFGVCTNHSLSPRCRP